MSRLAIHPGEILVGELEALHMSADALAEMLHEPTSQIS